MAFGWVFPIWRPQTQDQIFHLTYLLPSTGCSNFRGVEFVLLSLPIQRLSELRDDKGVKMLSFQGLPEPLWNIFHPRRDTPECQKPGF